MNSEKLIVNSSNIGVGLDQSASINAKMNKTNVGVCTSTTLQQLGITLIALIISIIVLLILAGVSISLLIGEYSIIEKANEAKTKYEQASQDEADMINGIIAMIDENGGGQQGPTFDPTKVPTTVTEQIDGKTVTATIPVGWTASEIEGENTISGGLVIYEGTITDWTDVNTLQTTKNQYVWIPVEDINSMVMCKNNAEGSVCRLELQGNNLICTTHTGVNAADLCGRLYGVGATTASTSAPYIYQTAMNFALTNQTFTANSGYSEPDILTAPYADGNTEYLTGIGIVASDEKTAQEVFADQLQADFNEMAKSVAKYGGFYIGRYEAGAAGASKKNQKVLTADSSNSTNYIGANRWYGLYNTIRNTNQPIVDRHMIWRKPV